MEEKINKFYTLKTDEERWLWVLENKNDVIIEIEIEEKRSFKAYIPQAEENIELDFLHESVEDIVLTLFSALSIEWQ